jgi:hypothetical protein
MLGPRILVLRMPAEEKTLEVARTLEVVTL